MKALFTVLIAALLIAQGFSQRPQNDVDAVLELLNQLKQQAVEELNRLSAQYQMVRGQKQATIQSINEARQEQNVECQNRNNDVSNKFEEIEHATQYINWMIERRNKNMERISVLSEVGCRGNINYINDVKNMKLFLRLIDYLRRALQNYEAASFIQTGTQENTIKQITQMVEIYKNKGKKIDNDFLKAWIQEFQEGGEVHVAESSDRPVPVQQLLAILDEMEAELYSNMRNGQDNEVEVGVTFSDFKVRIEKENEVFAAQIEEQKALIAHFQRQLVTLNNRYDKCQRRLYEIATTLEVAQQDLDDSNSESEADLTRILEEIQLFDELIRMYSGQVVDEVTEEQRNAIENNQDGDSQGGNAQQEGGDSNNGIIDFTPLDDDDGVWDDVEDQDSSSNEADSQQQASEDSQEQATDSSNTEAGNNDIIDFTPVEDDDNVWDAAESEPQAEESTAAEPLHVEAEPEQQPEAEPQAEESTAAEPVNVEAEPEQQPEAEPQAEAQNVEEPLHVEAEPEQVPEPEHIAETDSNSALSTATQKDAGSLKIVKEGSMQINKEGSMQINKEGSMQINKEGSMQINKEGSMQINKEGSMQINKEGSMQINKEGSMEINKVKQNSIKVNAEGSAKVDREGSLSVKREGSVAVKREGSMKVNGKGSVQVKGQGSVQVKGEGSIQTFDINAADQPDIDNLWV